MSKDFPAKGIFKEGEARRVFNQVFDHATLQAVHALAGKKYFKKVEHVVATGKEGNVFLCSSGKNNYALKIYKVYTSDFKHMTDYLKGDERFKGVRNTKLDIVKAWTKKEFRNLSDMNKAEIRVPLPIAYNRNCLVMEFIGDRGKGAPPAKKKPFAEPEKKYEIMCGYMAKMVSAGVVHADLSQYNILNNKEEMVIIDAGQAVSTAHPKAKEFFERDVMNLSKWFHRQGVDTDYNAMYAHIKEKKP